MFKDRSVRLCCVNFYFPVIFREGVGMENQAVGRHAASIYCSHILLALSPNNRGDSTPFNRKLIQQLTLCAYIFIYLFIFLGNEKDRTLRK